LDGDDDTQAVGVQAGVPPVPSDWSSSYHHTVFVPVVLVLLPAGLAGTIDGCDSTLRRGRSYSGDAVKRCFVLAKFVEKKEVSVV
jgi:hypothetical protein